MWARRAPEDEAGRVSALETAGARSLSVDRKEWPSLYVELETRLHTLADDLPLTVDLDDPSMRAFCDGARSVWQETHVSPC